MAELVGKRYASSLFEVGVELKSLEAFHNELDFIKDILVKEKKILAILDHPQISRKEKKDLVESIFGKNVSREMLNFLYILIDKRREDSLLDIVKEYNTLFKDYKNILDIEAVTAVPMKDSAKDKLSLVLKEKFDKDINLTNTVDPSILGGVLLNMDDKVIDSSLRNQLKEMESMFKTASL